MEKYIEILLVKMGLKRAQKYNKNVKVILGGGAVSVFYEQLGNHFQKELLFQLEREKSHEKIIKEIQ